MKKQFALAFAAACMALAASAECRAGFARVDTTPPLGISMPGYFSQRLSDGILDPICAECVAAGTARSERGGCAFSRPVRHRRRSAQSAPHAAHVKTVCK